MAAEDCGALQFLDSLPARPHPGGIPDNVPKTDDAADTKLADVSQNRIQRLEIRVNIADDGDGFLHDFAYCGRAGASTKAGAGSSDFPSNSLFTSL